MSKLGYTWYPKDWTNSEAVFQLTLQQRGLYRELIDIAMLNDNDVIINKRVWSRKFDIKEQDLDKELKTLVELKLIEIKRDKLFIPSCEPRLNLSRGGAKGGKKSKPTTKPTDKPTDKPTTKPSSNQIEREKKDKINIKEFIDDQVWYESKAMSSKWKFTFKTFKDIGSKFWSDNEYDDVESHYKDDGSLKSLKDIRIHFTNWLKYNMPPEEPTIVNGILINYKRS